MNQPVARHPTRYWHALPDGRVQCDVCPRFCKLNEGQRGLCFVRARQGGQIVLTTYGRSSGFCIDPIEKKPLNHFLPGTPVLSFGTAGCNLTCKFCQNWDISKARDLDRIQDVASPEAIADAALRSGCRSVAFTYNDPVIFLEYAIDVAQACRERGLKTVAVSAGYIAPQPRAEFFRHMDAANIDLKGFSERFYKDLCSGKLAAVLETLDYLKHETKVWFEITTLLIPRRKRFTSGNRSGERLANQSSWSRGAIALYGVSSGLEDDGPSADAAGNSADGEADRAQRRSSLRLYRQYSRPGRAIDFLPRLQHAVGGPRLV